MAVCTTTRWAYGVWPVMTRVVRLANLTGHSQQMEGVSSWTCHSRTALLATMAPHPSINVEARDTAAEAGLVPHSPSKIYSTHTKRRR